MDRAVLEIAPLGPTWSALDPFLFCVHHQDQYPRANDLMGPDASLAGRDLGQDFAGKDGWRMYHGERVPGFPAHPHRGFETVTVVRRGFIDHADSLDAAARYGNGDVQWLTAGQGIQHSEMFPLLDTGQPNPVELFQIWLNLPRADKRAEPHFSMFWANQVPRVRSVDGDGRATEVTVVAGRLGQAVPVPPPPRSWAARDDTHVAIWTLRLDAAARYTLPLAPAGVNRVLYFFAGQSLRADGQEIATGHAMRLRPDAPLALENGAAASELLLLQGRPIAEPVVQHGPFVMTTREEIVETFRDYQQTEFGGWRWPSRDPVHPRGDTRFARYADGRVDRP